MNKNNKPKQVLRVLDYLKEHGSITSKEAMNELGIWRLASRISEIKKLGYEIDSEFVEVVNRYGETCKIKRYSLQKEVA